MSAISPSLRIFSEGVAFFPILPRPAFGGARLLTCEPLSTVDWHPVQPGSGYVCGRSAGSPRGAAVWGLILPPAGTVQ